MSGLCRKRAFRLLAGIVFVIGSSAKPHAQSTFGAVGTRALGMGGAFLAVADDPSAVQWNPSGLVRGPLAGLTIGWHEFQVGKRNDPPATTLARGRTSLTALGTWPLGVSVGTFERTVVHRLPAGPAQAWRVRTQEGGITVLQTLSDILVAGATTRLVHAETAGARLPGGSLDDALELVRTIRPHVVWTVDLDVGVTATLGVLRTAATVRHLRSPQLGDAPGNGVRFPRQGRVGVAAGPIHGVTLATDIDLNTVAFLGDLRRMSALGAEISLGSRLFVRSGVRWNLAEPSGPGGAMGASLRVHRAWWLDLHAARGEGGARELSVTLRAAP